MTRIVIISKAQPADITPYKTRTAQVSWESAPGGRTGILSDYEKMPYGERQAYHNDMRNILYPEGRDLLAEVFGVPTVGTIDAVGAYGGDVNPGSQTIIRLPNHQAIEPGDKDKINAYASALGYLLHQNAVAWHHPMQADRLEDANGINVNLIHPDRAARSKDPHKVYGGRAATPEEMQKFYNHIRATSGHDEFAPIATAHGFRVLNFDGDNLPFHDKVRDALIHTFGEDPNTLPVVGGFQSEGDFIDNGWDEEHPGGEAYRHHIDRAGASDIFGRFADTLSKRIRDRIRAEQDQYHKGAGEEGAETDPDKARQEIALDHYGNARRDIIDPAYYGSAHAKKEAQSGDRVPRTYYYRGGTIPAPHFYDANKQSLKVPAALYNAAVDPSGFRERSGGNLAQMEREIAAHGWDGYVPHDAPHNVAMFRPVRDNGDRTGTLLTHDYKEFPTGENAKEVKKGLAISVSQKSRAGSSDAGRDDGDLRKAWGEGAETEGGVAPVEKIDRKSRRDTKWSMMQASKEYHDPKTSGQLGPRAYYSPKAKTLYVDPFAWEHIKLATNVPNTTAGLNMNKNLSEAVHLFLSEGLRQGHFKNDANVHYENGVKNLRDELGFAIGHNPHSVSVSPVTDPEQMLNTTRHESVHHGQRALADGMIQDHLPQESQDELMSHPIFQKAAERLRDYGYTEDEALHEIPAYIASHRHEDALGLNDDEAAEAMTHYVKHIVDHHGADAAKDIFRHARTIARRAAGLQKSIRIAIVQKAYTGTPKRVFGPEGAWVQTRPSGFDVHYTHPETGRRVGRLQIDYGQPGEAYVAAVDVDHRHSKRGIGTRLYEKAKEHLLKNGIHTLKGVIEGSGPVQMREKVFGSGNTRYFAGEEDYTPEEAMHRADKEYRPFRAETYLQNGILKKALDHEDSEDYPDGLDDAARTIEHCGDYGDLFWHPEKKRAYWVGGDSDGGDDTTSMEDIRRILGSVPGVNGVDIEAEYFPKSEDGWQRVKYNGKDSRKSIVVIISKAASQTSESYRKETDTPTHTLRSDYMIRPLDEATFQEHVAPNIANWEGNNLKDYQALHPTHTHVRLIKNTHMTSPEEGVREVSPGDYKFDSVGSKERLVPGDAERLSPGDNQAVQSAHEPEYPTYEEHSAPEKGGLSRREVQTALSQHFNLSQAESALLGHMVERWANTWANKTGKTPQEWWNTRIGGIGSGYSDKDKATISASRAYMLGGDDGVHGRYIWTPQDFADAGERHGVENLGPLSPIRHYTTKSGKEVGIPGGTDGDFTYLDKHYLKAQGIDPADLHDNLHLDLHKKLVRSSAMHPDSKHDYMERFNRILFGLMSPNTPLTDNEFAYARARATGPEDLQRLAEYAKHIPGAGVAKNEEVKWLSDLMRRDLKLQSMARGGMGINLGGSLPQAARFAQMYIDRPDFFAKHPNEDWQHYGDRLASQIAGAGTKVASFGGVWLDPVQASIMAVDRHIQDDYIENAPHMEPYRQILLDDWNANVENKRKEIEEERKKVESDFATGKLTKAAYRNEIKRIEDAGTPQPHKDFHSLFNSGTGKQYVREFTKAQMAGIKLANRADKYKTTPAVRQGNETYEDMLRRTGYINPRSGKNLADARTETGEFRYPHLLPYDPEHNPQGVNWVDEPGEVIVPSDMYMDAQRYYQNRAAQNGLSGFGQQWYDWDERRRRLEPHEPMHPGLYALPKQNIQNATAALGLHKQLGYYNRSNTPTLPISSLYGEGGEAYSNDEIPRLAYAQGSPSDPNALAHIARDGRYILQALKQPDLSSAIHEFGHVIRKDLSGSELTAVEKAMGVEDGKWTTDKEERFARSLERYFHDGIAPNEKSQKAYNYIKNWMHAIYPIVSEGGKEDYGAHAVNTKVHPDLRNVLDAYFGSPYKEVRKAIPPRNVILVQKAGRPGPYNNEMANLRDYLAQGFDPYDYQHHIQDYLDEYNDNNENAPEHYQDEEEWLEHHTPEEKQDFKDYIDRQDGHYRGYDSPPYETMDSEGFKKPKYLVHFTDNPDSISRDGFLYGHPDMYRGLALTTWKRNRQQEPGYNFAFDADTRHASRAAYEGKYGDHAVVFPSSSVKVWHHGDEEPQHIFHGPSVNPRDIHPIHKNDNGMWDVHGYNDRPLKTDMSFEDAVNYVKDNHRMLSRIKQRTDKARFFKSIVIVQKAMASHGLAPVSAHFDKPIFHGDKIIGKEFNVPGDTSRRGGVEWTGKASYRAPKYIGVVTKDNPKGRTPWRMQSGTAPEGSYPKDESEKQQARAQARYANEEESKTPDPMAGLGYNARMGRLKALWDVHQVQGDTGNPDTTLQHPTAVDPSLQTSGRYAAKEKRQYERVPMLRYATQEEASKGMKAMFPNGVLQTDGKYWYIHVPKGTL